MQQRLATKPQSDQQALQHHKVTQTLKTSAWFLNQTSLLPYNNTLARLVWAHLGKTPHSEEAMHGSGALISVDSSKLSKAQRQVPIAVLLVLVHGNVEGTVHGA